MPETVRKVDAVALLEKLHFFLQGIKSDSLKILVYSSIFKTQKMCVSYALSVRFLYFTTN